MNLLYLIHDLEPNNNLEKKREKDEKRWKEIAAKMRGKEKR